MKIHSTQGYDGFYVEYCVDEFGEIFDVFNMRDEEFIRGTAKEPSPDFDLHLALYILKHGKCPDEVMAGIEQWCRENKKIVLEEV